jgi:hypothetical protein
MEALLYVAAGVCVPFIPCTCCWLGYGALSTCFYTVEKTMRYWVEYKRQLLAQKLGLTYSKDVPLYWDESNTRYMVIDVSSGSMIMITHLIGKYWLENRNMVLYLIDFSQDIEFYIEKIKTENYTRLLPPSANMLLMIHIGTNRSFFIDNTPIELKGIHDEYYGIAAKKFNITYKHIPREEPPKTNDDASRTLLTVDDTYLYDAFLSH